MATILLDTSVIFDHLTGRLGRTGYLSALLGQGHMLACCPVNVAEVYAQVQSGEEGPTRQFLESLEYYAITPEVAARAGSLCREWRRRGHTLPLTSAMIAAVALSNGLALLTGNRDQFPMPELTLFRLPPQ